MPRLICTAVAILLVGASAQAADNALQPAPKIEVAVDEEFQLAKNETARIRELGLLVTLTELYYTRCFPGAMCIRADGPGVVFEVRDADSGKVAFRGNDSAAPPSHFPWFVHYIASDGRTFARLAAHRTADWCRQRASANEATHCWQRTAELARDAGHCAQIADPQARSWCVDNVARQTKNAEACRFAPDVSACYETAAAQLAQPALCEKVKQPQSYCVIQAVAASGDIERCSKLQSPRLGCYIAAAKQANSLDVCERLRDPYRWECRNVMKGERVELPSTPRP